MEIDWSKAPEWATRFCHVGMNRLAAWANDTQYTYVVGGMAGRIFKIGTDEGFPESAMHTIECSPAPWTGTGLPPVGTVCEFAVINDLWSKCKVIHHSKKKAAAVVLYGHDFEGVGWAMKFRPIRTPEQIAAEEREKAIKEMILFFELDELTIESLGKLYDAGYRKTEAP